MTRDEYLSSLSRKYAAPMPLVKLLAEILGPNEDHDGLITELEMLSREGFDDFPD